MAKISWTTPLKMWPKFFFSIFFLNCKDTSITLSVHHEFNVFKAIADRFPIETYWFFFYMFYKVFFKKFVFWLWRWRDLALILWGTWFSARVTLRPHPYWQISDTMILLKKVVFLSLLEKRPSYVYIFVIIKNNFFNHIYIKFI